MTKPPPTLACPLLYCFLPCIHGSVLDARGCDSCDCLAPPTPIFPDPVRLLTVKVQPSGMVRVQWVPPASGFECGTDFYEIAYRPITRGALPSTARWAVQEPTPEPFVFLEGLRPDTAYRVRVTAVSTSGPSSPVTRTVRVGNVRVGKVL